MPSIRMSFAPLVVLLAISADAGIVYRFSTKSTALGARDMGGRVWVEGDRSRVELDPDPSNPRPWDVQITAGGKMTFINLQNKTYFHDPAGSFGTAGSAGRLFHLPFGEDHIDGKPRITYRNAGAGAPVAGHPTTTHVFELHYRLIGELQGTKLKGAVDATITVVAVPALPRRAGGPVVQTGFAQIDEELAGLAASIEGLIVVHEQSVGRRIDRGVVISEYTKMSVDELKETPLDDRVFAIPPGLTFQEPVMAGPGR